MLWKADVNALRHQMVATQILDRGIRESRILQAMEEIPRHKFVPYTPAKEAYGDGPLPIGQGQTISQPYITAYMTDLLDIEPHHRVLEIGTGSGYQAAILSLMAAEVYTMEIVVTHYIRAQKILKSLKLGNIHQRLGNGREGWPEMAPFDRIMVTAASREVPEVLLRQLKDGGLLVMPAGASPLEQRLQLYRRKKNKVLKQSDLAVRFVPLVHGD